MKHILTVAAFLLPCISFAQAQIPPLPVPPPPVAYQPPPGTAPSSSAYDYTFSHGIRIVEFARIVLQDVLKAPYILGSDFLQSDAQVGFSAKELKRSGSENLLRDVLSEHGYTLTKTDGYYRVLPTKASDRLDTRQDFFYTPKHRDIGYLTRILSPLFPGGGLTNKRSIDAPDSATNDKQKRPSDNGDTLYSSVSGGDSDALVFRGEPKEVERVKAILSQIDTPVPRVLVRALILEVQSQQTTGYSVSAVGSLLSSRLGINIQADSFSKQLSFKAGSFSAVASALADDGTVRVLNAPSAFAETGATAKLSVGASVPTLGAITVTDSGRAQQSVEYRETGVLLTVSPKVFSDSISLTVNQELSDAVVTTTGVSASPTLTKRGLSTVLNMSSGEWVILGGLATNKASDTQESLPFWRSLKTGRNTSSSSTDIVVLLYVERS